MAGKKDGNLYNFFIMHSKYRAHEMRQRMIAEVTTHISKKQMEKQDVFRESSL